MKKTPVKKKKSLVGPNRQLLLFVVGVLRKMDVLISLSSSFLLLTLTTTSLLLLVNCGTVSSTYDTSMVHRLLTDRNFLIEEGLSYFNGTRLKDVRKHSDGHEIRCIISIENWTKWMLTFPVVYNLYGDFQFGKSFAVVSF